MMSKAAGFDAIIEELEQLVGQLEGDELPLERSLEVFERGIALSRQGQSILDRAEKRIEVLLRDGTTEPADLDIDGTAEQVADVTGKRNERG